MIDTMLIKRVIWAYIIALSAVFSLSAQETDGSPEFEYCLLGSSKSRTIGIMGIKAGEKCPSHVTIPDTYKGYPVTEIMSKAFKDCTELCSIDLPKHLKIIWEHAFQNTSLKSLVLPDSVIEIHGAFSDSITEKITVYGDIPMSAFQLTPNLKEVVIKGGNVGPLAFNYSGVKKIIFEPDSKAPTDSIGFGAFNFCTALQELELPETVRHIGFCAMEECSSLRKVILPVALDSIPHFLFSGCRSLQSVEIPSSVSQIPNTAFRHCKSLKELRILGDDNTPAIHFGMDALRYSNIEKLYLDRPWDNAVSPFFGTESLVELELGKHITALPNFAFGNCSSLVKIHCANPEPPTLGRGAFRGVSRSACTVTVAGSDNGYRNAETWKEFFDDAGAQPVINDNISIYAACGDIYVESLSDSDIEIFGPSGKLVRVVTSTAPLTRITMPRGYYIICQDNVAKKNR